MSRATTSPPPGKTEPRGTKPKADAPRPSKLTGSPEAKLRACVVLEVLGGLRTPADGSVALGISIQRYYLLETRALQGLLSALDAKAKRGRQASPEGQVTRLKAERDRLERELRRTQALVRLTQRTIGLAPAKEPPKEKGKRKGRHRPTVRARKLAMALRVEGSTLTTATHESETACAVAAGSAP